MGMEPGGRKGIRRFEKAVLLGTDTSALQPPAAGDHRNRCLRLRDLRSGLPARRGGETTPSSLPLTDVSASSNQL